ncbi:VWA domain-containing protein (plasmid) [Rhodococcus sp. ZPP]|uniref:vWA domain-containing protein n=1 Tax=Rhodococcus TaxID=1827 RepID=UPI0006BB47ED|nr:MULTISPECIES: VWA domain-containing protein [Rhodococcus]QHE73665.1 tellurium resistance protein [Rhodococcus sp. WAY2]QTJ71175.1 VWA domain-containing protein [Rhodococcus sp. ZPP]
MTSLTRGANSPIDTATTTVEVTGARQGTVDLFVFQLGADLKVRTDADLVFFNNPSTLEGAVTLTGGQVTLHLAAVPAAIDTLAVAVALDENVPGSLAEVPGLSVTLTQAGGTSFAIPAEGLTTEWSAVLLEVYRRNGSWKVRNRSAGWSGGLDALVTEHGVSVDETPAQAPEPAQSAVAAATSATVDGEGVRTVPGEATLSLVKREKLNLQKREVAKVLLSKGAASPVGRVVLVMDNTGSMSKRYRSGEVKRIIERMVPVATQLDSDGNLEAYAYAQRFVKLPDVTVADADTWVNTYVHLRGRHGGIDFDAIGGTNNEIPVMEEIIGTLDKATAVPTLVLFFTDGGFNARAQITALMRTASAFPAFWQFIGIGKSSFGVLEKLDTLTGRLVDNAGFFAVENVDTLTDTALYELLLSEYPDWLRAARQARVLS